MNNNQHPLKNKLVWIRFWAGSWSLALLVGLLTFAATGASAQAIRRPGKIQRQIQKKLEKQGTNKLNPAGESPSTTPRPPETAGRQDFGQPQSPPLDGIRNRNILTMFSREEAQLIIPGFGRPPALLIIFRQLQLTPEQREQIKALSLRIGDRLRLLHQDRARLEQQMEEAIYGENFTAGRVDELAAQAAEKQAEIIKMQASIEARFRQILSPDQFYVFQFLIGEMVLPQRRINPQQLRQQQRRLGPNAPNRPPLERNN